jgi:hypothetical protein
MTLPRSAADVLACHVLFELECIDRIYCNLYVPKLQRDLGVVGFIREHLGKPVASTAVLADRTRAFYAEIRAFAARQQVPVVEFAAGQRKDDVMREHLAEFLAAGRTEGVVFIGRAQEKVAVFATTRRRDAEGNSYPWIVRGTRVVTQWYFYCYDACAGPFFLKYCGYFPYNAKLCCNGNEYAKAMAARTGIGFTALDNGFAAVDDTAAVQAICDSFDETVIWDLAAKWMAILPCPFTAGYRYEVSILQAEFSLTQVLDAPVTGRIFFEQVIRDNLDIGRPDQVGLIFARRIIRKGPRATPGRFRTRVITEGVVPTLHIDYKHSKIKQYHRKAKRSEQGPRSTTAATSASANGSITCPSCGQPASQPPGVCWTSRNSATTPPTARPPSPRSPVLSLPRPGPASRACAWATPASTPCSRPCACSGSFPAASPTATCAPSSRNSSACPPSPSPRGR